MSENIEPFKLRQLFIGGLNSISTEESLKSHFEQWGEIVACVVKTDIHTRKSRGFGFITYKRAHMVDDAQAARPHEIDGLEVDSRRIIPIQNYGKPEARVKVNNLYVSGVNEDWNEEELREYFGSYGHIVKIDIVTDKNTGKKRGFAVVKFDDYDPVDKILLQRHNCKGRELIVEKFLSREERYNIKMKEEIERFQRGRVDCAGSRGKLSSGDGFVRVVSCEGYTGSYGHCGYGGRFNNGGGVWNDCYPACYPSGGGCGNLGSSYIGGPIQDNTAYALPSQRPYGGKRGSGGFGGRYNSRGGVWNDVYPACYPSGGGGGNFGSSCVRGPAGGNTDYEFRRQRHGRGGGR